MLRQVRTDGSPLLIDNDHELGGRMGYAEALARQQGPPCSPSSLFLPFNLESWRVRARAQPTRCMVQRCPAQDPASSPSVTACCFTSQPVLLQSPTFVPKAGQLARAGSLQPKVLRHILHTTQSATPAWTRLGLVQLSGEPCAAVVPVTADGCAGHAPLERSERRRAAAARHGRAWRASRLRTPHGLHSCAHKQPRPSSTGALTRSH